MGCDIHGWIEVKKNDKWIAISELPDMDRNYVRFARLAGVRDYRNESTIRPFGVPEDVSETTKYHIDHDGEDGHSHSYLSILFALKIFHDTAYEKSQWPMYRHFGLDEDYDDVANMRLVFWFDN